MNLLFLPVQGVVNAAFDFQQMVVVLTTEVVDKVETKKNRPTLSLGKFSEETTVAKRPRTIMPNIIYHILVLVSLNVSTWHKKVD